MRELGEKYGLIERPSVDEEAMEQAIGGLSKRRYVLVVGPPNQNSDLGMDVDELRLLPYGTDYLRSRR